MIEAFVAVVVALLAIAAWQEHRWCRSPLGQATLALARARRQRRSAAARRWRAAQWAAAAAVAALAWLVVAALLAGVLLGWLGWLAGAPLP